MGEAATSYRRTPQPASIPGTGPIRSNSTLAVTVMCQPALRWTKVSSKQIGLARCPFDLTTMQVNDGRNATMANSAFGTVFGVVDGRPLPVCDYAGFAPVGLVIAAAPASSSPFRSLRIFCGRSGAPREPSAVWTCRTHVRCRSVRTPSSTTTSHSPGRPNRETPHSYKNCCSMSLTLKHTARFPAQQRRIRNSALSRPARGARPCGRRVAACLAALLWGPRYCFGDPVDDRFVSPRHF